MLYRYGTVDGFELFESVTMRCVLCVLCLNVLNVFCVVQSCLCVCFVRCDVPCVHDISSTLFLDIRWLNQGGGG